MRRITPFLFILVLSVLATSARAQEVDLSGRTRLSDLLNKPLSPRAAAMGNSFVAMKDDPNTIFSNPAAISSITIKDSSKLNDFSISYSHYVLDIDEGALVYDHPVPEGMLFGGTFAAGVQYFSGGSSTEATNTGQTLGTFSTGDVALVLAYSSTGANGLHYGAGVKFVSSSLVSGSSVQNYSASWMAADLGLYYEWVKQQMTFGFSVLNIGTQVSTYAGTQEPVGPNVQFGLSKKLERLPLTLQLNFHNVARDREGRNLLYALNDFSLGGEFVLGKVVRLRFGYENQVRHELAVPAGTGLAGLSMGLGLHLAKYDIDFGLNDNGPDFAPFLRFGLRTAF